MGKAVTYAQNQWNALLNYLNDGILAIDNNLAERVIKMVALGRKNWLFAGSDAGAKRAAVLYSLVASCKLCDIDPFFYLRDVLDRINTHPASRIEELVPHRPSLLDESNQTQRTKAVENRPGTTAPSEQLNLFFFVKIR